jgi:UDP-glucose 4-epimerase
MRRVRVEMMRRACITGGAGFIGSNLAERLSDLGVEVVIVDDFRTGRREFIADLLARPGVRLVVGDVLDPAVLEEAVKDCDWVFHMQANADVRLGLEHPRRDLEQNTIATANVLEAMRARGVRRIVFASTGSVYGEPDVFPTPEDAPFPVQTSLYGASKLAGEGLIAAYAAGYGFTGVICRFVSILGERYTHGHVFDFYRALKRDPTRLRVLGDGRQEKSYLYIQDCIRALLSAAEQHHDEPGAHIYNLGTDETIVVDDSLAIIAEHLMLKPHVEHLGGRRGWTGDSPLILLNTDRIRGLGWRPRLTIRQALVRTLEWLDANEYAWRDRAATPGRRERAWPVDSGGGDHRVAPGAGDRSGGEGDRQVAPGACRMAPGAGDRPQRAGAGDETLIAAEQTR